ncbi:14261_t:CDS:2 [Cetraspora pellucida]|uniref:14261_t:CDS:1 n=1 Tax=Cetraspora pellucida TaxID=1433469 RepID=A0ACA9MSQ2_9GLOM|nr:14261_t:CDS:2 [Cetraspora pellucida]
MRGNELTNEQRDQIIGAYLAGSNASKISAALSIACTTVYETINRYKKTGSPYPKKRSGHSKALSSRDQRSLQRIILKDRFSPLNKVTNELNLNFNTTYHPNTIHNYLHNFGLRGHVARFKPFLKHKDLFQQDLAPCHTAQYTKWWMKTHNIPILDWVPYSPDLNPIEHLWDYLDCQVRKRKPLPSSKNELIKAIQEEWAKIPLEVLRNLILSMPD